MNGKKRWQIAIIFSITVHILLLIFVSHQINKWLPPPVPLPAQEDIAVFIDDTEPVDDNTQQDDNDNAAPPVQPDSAITIPSETPAAQSAEQPELTPSTKPTQSPSVEQQNTQSSTNNKKKRPQRYSIPSLKGVNLADIIDPMHPPALPPLIKKVEFTPPAKLLASPHPIEVEVKYIIEADGSVHADISKSSGDEDIDDAAIEAISAWRYEPSDKPYPIPVPYQFRWPPAE